MRINKIKLFNKNFQGTMIIMNADMAVMEIDKCKHFKMFITRKGFWNMIQTIYWVWKSYWRKN